MRWWLYNVLFAVAYVVMLPHFLLRMKRRGGYRSRMGDRFGRYPADVLTRLQQSGARSGFMLSAWARSMWRDR